MKKSSDSIQNIYPLEDEKSLDILLDKIGDSRFVLIGEASHGTSDYYKWRALITKRLIKEKGFSFVAVEGDWPDCYKINEYVKAKKAAGNVALDVLYTFNRWPTWMWANREISSFVEWLRKHNDMLNAGKKVGFYGLDIYSLWESLQEVMAYLKRRGNKKSMDSAKRAFMCFEPYSGNMEDYARDNLFVPSSCEHEVVEMLKNLRNQKSLAKKDRERFFNAEQNAILVKNADTYYRTMIRGNKESWNIRDNHMVETLERLMKHHGSKSKAIIWAHNTHVGDARATDMASSQMINIGQLVREKYPDETFIIGFGSYEGSVIAGPYWGAPMEKMAVPPAVKTSYEYILHQRDEADKLVIFNNKKYLKRLNNVRYLQDIPKGNASLNPIPHRAIGVVYSPYNEFGNYVPSIMPLRYDAFLHIDRTSALHPLHMKEEEREMETYPFGV